MTRQASTQCSGGAFTAVEIQEVWNKGAVISGKDKDFYRKDTCGAEIYRHSYGMTSEMGWEIDHIKPVSKGGSDHLSNLQPLQWENNRHKADNWPQWSCKLP